MAIDAAVYQLLRDDAGVSALIGSGASARVYPQLLPHGQTLPACVFQMVDVDPVHASGTTVALRAAEYQITCYASTYEAAVGLADQVRDALSRHSGTVDGTVIQEVFYEQEQDTYEFDTSKFGRLMRFRIWYEGAADG